MTSRMLGTHGVLLVLIAALAGYRDPEMSIVATVDAPFGSRSQLSGTDEAQVRELYDQMKDVRSQRR